jgi:hypothetical protein
MIKTSGYRVSPTEVEEAVFSSGAIGVAAAVGMDNGNYDQSIVVFITPKAGARPDIEAILNHCRAKMPAYMVPRHIVVRVSLDVNGNGKIDRKALKAEIAGWNPSSLTAAATLPGFVQRWKDKRSGAMRKRSAGSVMKVFQSTFPERAISANHTFQSLEGDSLSYVSLSLGLEELIGNLPDDWENMPIDALEKMERATPSVMTSLRIDIFLRAAAILAVVANHARIFPLEGVSFILIVLAGMSFARFNWSTDGGHLFRSVAKMVTRIVIPTWLMLTLLFSHLGGVVWSVAFFYDNLVTSQTRYWWPPAWFLQVLFQCFLVMLLLGLSPSVRKAGHDRPYLFGLALVGVSYLVLIGAIVADIGFSTADRVPQCFFWMFSAGWLICASQTRRRKIAASAIIAGILLTIVVAAGGLPALEKWEWREGAISLAIGCMPLIWIEKVTVPRHLAFIAALLARSTLFVYVFHWPVAKVLDGAWGNWQLANLVSLPASIAIWAIWDATARYAARLLHSLRAAHFGNGWLAVALGLSAGMLNKKTASFRGRGQLV